MEFKNIVVGLDVSGSSDVAAKAAFALGRSFGSEVNLVHAVDYPFPFWTDIDANVLAAARETVGKWLQAIPKAERPGDQEVDRHLHVAAGHPAKVLLDQAGRHGADLILLGPHRRGRTAHMGSTARAVLGKASCGVWVQPGEPAPIRRILVPVDLSEQSLHALSVACRFAGTVKARVTVLHCFLPPILAYEVRDANLGPVFAVDELREAQKSGFEKEMQEFDWKGIPHEALFVEGEPAAEVIKRQDEHELIIMGSHGRTGLAATILGNVAWTVVQSSRIPVLAIRAKDRKWLT